MSSAWSVACATIKARPGRDRHRSGPVPRAAAGVGAAAVDEARALARRYSGTVPAKLREVDRHLAPTVDAAAGHELAAGPVLLHGICGPATC